MKIIEITEKTRPAYENFLATHPLADVHQTWQWGLFQSKSAIRDKFWVFAVVDGNGQILASAMVIRQNLPFGKCWLYCPRGPLGDYSNQSAPAHPVGQTSSPAPLKLLFEKIASLAREQRAVFFRFDPPIEAGFTPQVKATLADLHARPAHAHYQPESTLILDLKHQPEAILRQMKPKGRYNIKVAQKHGVTVRVSEFGTRPGAHTSDIEAFYALLRQTTERDSFSGHPLSYYKNMLEVLAPAQAPSAAIHPAHSAAAHPAPAAASAPAHQAPCAKLYLASHNGKVLAGMIATYYRDTATYYFGASSSENRHTMAPYLLHWQAIQDARSAGYHYYDFFGIAPENQPGHPWQKVTEFKLKFGGERVNYLPAQEIIYSPFWYAAIRLAKWARGILKR